MQLLGDLIDIFLADSDALIAQVEDAVTSQDAEGLDRAAHKLRGAASIFGGHGAMKTAMELRFELQKCAPNKSAVKLSPLERYSHTRNEAKRAAIAVFDAPERRVEIPKVLTKEDEAEVGRLQ